MTETYFVKYRVTWSSVDSNDEEKENNAELWLRENDDPEQEIGALLNLADLDASETGYGYEVKKLETVQCRTYA